MPRKRKELEIVVKESDEPMPEAQFRAWANRYVRLVLELEGTGASKQEGRKELEGPQA